MKFKNKIIKFLEDGHAKCLSMHMEYVEPKINILNMKNNPFNGTKNIYCDPVFETLLNYVKPKVEKAYGKSLTPTYSFWRTYYKNQECVSHKDRPACQVSVSICIDASQKDNLWSIYADNKEFKFGIGEGVIYKGCEQEHWRDPLTYDWHRQVFLHYIETEGKYYPEHMYDKRKDLYTDMKLGGI